MPAVVHGETDERGDSSQLSEGTDHDCSVPASSGPESDYCELSSYLLLLVR